MTKQTAVHFPSGPLPMSFSSLPLSYCTNVHPAQTVMDVQAGIDQFSLPIQAASGDRLAVGLWLSRSVVDDLKTPEQRSRFQKFLAERDLSCYTLNAFPYGNFHSERVKEQVYLPDWTRPDRLQYTLDCARVLADLLPPGVEGSISTVPLGFKALAASEGFLDDCSRMLSKCAVELERLYAETGRRIRLAIEPEPLCVLETTPETLRFFQKLRQQAESEAVRQAIQEYLGVCYDVCHQAVEFEDVAESIATLAAADIRINKVHLSCAIEAKHATTNPEVAAALSRYIEPRYLHQTLARLENGEIERVRDLDTTLLMQPPPALARADVWRVHFHVPIDAERLGVLGTTRPQLELALAAVQELPYAPHLEVETYTWEVMPGGGKPEVVAGFAREMRAARELLQSLATSDRG